MLLSALIYWAAVFGGVFTVALLGFTILDWILDR